MQVALRLLTNKYFVGIVSPAAFLVLGAIGRGVIKREHTYRNWFLGFDASLTALYAGMVYLYDLSRDSDLVISRKLVLTGSYLILTFMLFLVVVACHQSYEDQNAKEKAVIQFIVLGIIANMIGFGLLLVFVLVVKGVT